MNFFKKLFNLNQVVSIFIVFEFILITSFGFLVPIFSLFVINDIRGGSITTVGFALAVYWIVKSVLQLPVGRWLDRNKGEIDDFWSLFFGSCAGALATIAFFFFGREIWHLYTYEVILGVADAFTVPPIYAIFSRHLDKDHEGFEWSVLSSVSFGAGSALGGALGGIIAGMYGFRLVLLFAGLGALTASIVLLLVRPYIRPKRVGGDGILIEMKRL